MNTTTRNGADLVALDQAKQRLNASIQWLRHGSLLDSTPLLSVSDMEVIAAALAPFPQGGEVPSDERAAFDRYWAATDDASPWLAWKASAALRATPASTTSEATSDKDQQIATLWEQIAHRDRIADVLRAQIDSAAQVLEAAWQPISTAPKYTPIRLYAQGGGFYDEDFNPSGSVEGHWCDDSGWIGAFWDGEHDCWQRREDIVPTHWMPLPAAPDAARLSPPVGGAE